MSGLVIYVGASESGNAGGADVCILSKHRCSITLSVSFLQRFQVVFSIYIVFFFLFCLAFIPVYVAVQPLGVKQIHTGKVNRTQGDVKKRYKPNVVTSKVITRPRRSHGHISITVYTHAAP